jgi:hypothetical protein
MLLHPWVNGRTGNETREGSQFGAIFAAAILQLLARGYIVFLRTRVVGRCLYPEVPDNK